MAPRRRGKTDPDSVAPNALVASAARLDLSKKPRGAIQQEWQADAWEFYDTVGELRYAAQWMGNSLSRATIYVADVGDDGKPSQTATENPTALSAAHDLLGGPTNQAQILAQVGVHLTIAGDCYIVGETPVDELGTPLPDDEWYVASTDELSYSAGTWYIDRGNGRRALVTDQTVIIRVWQSHPRKKWQADSPVRAVLPVLRELRQLVRVAGQQMDSRLAGAGILVLPIGVQFPAPSPDALAANPDADPLMLSLAENIMVPLEDPDDSSRLVPMVLRVPPEAVDKIKPISFASQLQAENSAMRKDCITRLALGLDMPPEQLLGMGSANHWGAWQIEESGVKLHIAPKLTTIVNAINEGYYEPALKRLGLDPFAFSLWFDVTELVQRPNRSADARDLHSKGELSGDALRAAAGFTESDAPTVEERTISLLVAAAERYPLVAPLMLPALLHLWGGGKVTDMPPVPVPNQDTGSGQADPAADPSAAPVGTTRALPAPPPASLGPVQEAIVAATEEVRAVAPEHATPEIVCAHLLTQRALELAGKRLLTRERRGQYGDTDVRELHRHVKVNPVDLPRLLAGAFDWIDELAGMVPVDPAAFRAELTEYVGSLLTSGQPHDVRYLAAVIRKTGSRRAA